MSTKWNGIGMPAQIALAAAAIAASAALPPERNTSSAVSVALGCDVAAIPFAAMAADRPGTLKSRIVCFPGPSAVASRVQPSGFTLAGH